MGMSDDEQHRPGPPASSASPPPEATSKTPPRSASIPHSPGGFMFEPPSRREILKRVGLTAGVLGGAALLGRGLWDKGGFGVAAGQGARQVRDYRLRDRAPEHAELA